MKKYWPLLIACLVVLIGINATFKYTESDYRAAILIKEDTFKIQKNCIVKLQGASSFTFDFVLPKTEQSCIDIYASDKKDDYYKFISGKPTSSLKPFKSGNAYSVATNAYNTLTNELIVSDAGHQPFVFEKPEFMSFHRMRTMPTEYGFQYDVKDIRFLNDAKDISKKIHLHKFKSDTLYLIVTFSSYSNEKWKDIETTAFRVALR